MKKFISLWAGVALLAGSLTGYTAWADTTVLTVAPAATPLPMSVQIGSDGTVRVVGIYGGQDIGVLETPLTTTTTEASTSSVSGSALASLSVFTATLSGSREVPGNTSPAMGSATIAVSADQRTADISVTFSGLIGNQTAAHIHGPAAPDQNAGVLFPLPQGQITSERITLTPQQYSDLASGKWYVNIHSANFPDGEIRGQFVPIAESNPTPTVTTILVTAWGTTWSVEVNDETEFMRRDKTDASLAEFSIGDPVTVIGTMVTPAAQLAGDDQTIDQSGDTGVSLPVDPKSLVPRIVASSVQDKAIQVRSMGGTISDASNLDGGSLIMKNNLGQPVVVYVSPSTTISINSGSNPLDATNTLSSTMKVTVQGLYNNQRSVMNASSVVARVVSLPRVFAPTITVTPATLPSNTTTAENDSQGIQAAEEVPAVTETDTDTDTDTNTSTNQNTSTLPTP